jgi:hypothetical protein
MPWTVYNSDGKILQSAELGDNAVTNAKMADDAIDSAELAAGSVDLAHMSVNSIDSDQYVDASIDRVHLAADIVDGTKIADDVIDSEHYAAASIDNEHLADDAVGVAELSATGTASSSTFLRGDNAWAAAVTDISCRLTGSSSTAQQTAANNASTPITWNETATFDTDTMHSTSPNPSRITFTTAGKYIVTGQIVFANSDINGARTAYIRLNGSGYIAAHSMMPADNANHQMLNPTTGVYYFAATDYVELVAGVDDASGSVGMYVNSPMWFSAVRVGQ